MMYVRCALCGICCSLFAIASSEACSLFLPLSRLRTVQSTSSTVCTSVYAGYAIAIAADTCAGVKALTLGVVTPSARNAIYNFPLFFVLPHLSSPVTNPFGASQKVLSALKRNDNDLSTANEFHLICSIFILMRAMRRL